jgi:hypothetical protein
LTGLVACFKTKFPLVGPPDDIAGDSITTPPDMKQLHRKVLIIGIGGCRGDAMKKADAPNIQGLLPHAIYSFDALTKAPTEDAPGWASLLTGVWSNKHGINDNSFSGNNTIQYPMFYRFLKIFNPQLRTVSICSWNSVNDELVSHADVAISTNLNDIAAKDSAIAHLKNDDPDVMFLDLEGVSLAGRQYGFDTTVAQYMQAITTIDGYVGEIIQSLGSRSNIANEDWLIVLSSDHGGTMSGYGGDTYPELNVFTIFYNKEFQSTALVPSDFTLQTANMQNYGQYAFVKDPSDDNFLDFNHYTKFTAQVDIKSAHLEGDDPILTNKDFSSGANPGWLMTVNGQGWKFNIGGTRRLDVVASAPVLSDNKWHNIAITVDKERGIVSLYQDDTLRNTDNIAGITTWNTNTGSDIKLTSGDDITGKHKYWQDPTGTMNSVFTIANIRIWDTVIAESDMAKYTSSCNTDISSDNPYKNNLVAWWKGTDGNGSSFKDYGPYNIDMQLANNPPWVQQQIDLCNNPIPPSVPTAVDIVPVILRWLNVSIDPGWHLDGISWIQ